MPNRITRAALLSVACSLFLVTAAVAQEKSAPKVLERTTTSMAARAALTTALDEVTNIGGGRRFDDKLQAVITADPNFALGRAWYGAWMSTLTPAERQTELTRALQEAAAHGSTAEVLFITALRESRAGRNPVARNLLDVVLKLTPDDPDVHWARLLIAADPEEALRMGAAAVKQFPTYAPIYNIHAYQLNSSGRTDEALAAVARYVELAPNHPNPHDSFAELLQLNGRYDEADTHYVQALAKDPQFDEALIGRAEIAVLRRDYGTARSHLAQAMAMSRTPARQQSLQRVVAATFVMEGKLKDAKAVMVKSIADGGNSSLNTVPDQRALAFLAALEGNSVEARKAYPAAAANAGATVPLSDVIMHTLLKRPADVATALIAMEANAAAAPGNLDTQQAMFAARVISFVMKNDLNAARAAQQQVTGESYKAMSSAFVAHAARKAGDKTLALSSEADVEAYKDLTLNAGFARLIAARK